MESDRSGCSVLESIPYCAWSSPSTTFSRWVSLSDSSSPYALTPTTGGDFPTLLTDIHIESDGITTDPAAWADRLPMVRRASGWGNDFYCAILQSQLGERRIALLASCSRSTDTRPTRPIGERMNGRSSRMRRTRSEFYPGEVKVRCC